MVKAFTEFVTTVKIPTNNLISTHGNQKETQPHYYEDTFMELADLVMSQTERRCS